MSQLTPEQMFDSFAISVNGPRAWDLDLAIDVTFDDVDTNYRLTLRNGVLVLSQGGRRPLDRRGDGHAGETSCGCWRSPQVTPRRPASTSPAIPPRCRR